MFRKIVCILPLSFLVACSAGEERSEGVCPEGHSDSIVPIIYGFPTRETMERSERGEAELGGCDMDSASPLFHCKIHDLDF